MSIPTQLVFWSTGKPYQLSSYDNLKCVHAQFIHDGTTWKKVKQLYCHDGTSWVKIYDIDAIDYKSYALTGRSVTEIFNDTSNNKLVIINYNTSTLTRYISTWDGTTFTDIKSVVHPTVLTVYGYTGYTNTYIYSLNPISSPSSKTYYYGNGVSDTTIPNPILSFPGHSITKWTISKYGVPYCIIYQSSTSTYKLITYSGTWQLHSVLPEGPRNINFPLSVGDIIIYNTTYDRMYVYNGAWETCFNYVPGDVWFSSLSKYTYQLVYGEDISVRTVLYSDSVTPTIVNSVTTGMYNVHFNNNKFYYISTNQETYVADSLLQYKYSIKTSEVAIQYYNINNAIIDSINGKIYAVNNNIITVKNFRP